MSAQVAEAPPQVAPLSLSAPVTIPAATTLAALLPLVYTLSGNLGTASFRLIGPFFIEHDWII